MPWKCYWNFDELIPSYHLKCNLQLKIRTLRYIYINEKPRDSESSPDEGLWNKDLHPEPDPEVMGDLKSWE